MASVNQRILGEPEGISFKIDFLLTWTDWTPFSYRLQCVSKEETVENRSGMLVFIFMTIPIHVSI